MSAPKVTIEHIESLIESEVYFTGGEAVNVSSKIVLGGDLEPLDKLTFCVLVLKNGFTVTGESAPVSAENFDAQIGRDFARKKAVDQIWLLEGYLLKQKISGN